MNTAYRKGYAIHQGPRRRLPEGPQPQNWQTKVQPIADAKALDFLLADGLKVETTKVRASGLSKFPPIPIEIANRPNLLYFVYAGSFPNEEDLAKNGIIITAFAKYYQGLPLKNIKPEYRQEILRQVFESSGYQIFKHKRERKLKFSSMHSD